MSAFEVLKIKCSCGDVLWTGRRRSGEAIAAVDTYCPRCKINYHIKFQRES